MTRCLTMLQTQARSCEARQASASRAFQARYVCDARLIKNNMRKFNCLIHFLKSTNYEKNAGLPGLRAEATSLDLQ